MACLCEIVSAWQVCRHPGADPDSVDHVTGELYMRTLVPRNFNLQDVKQCSEELSFNL